MAGKKHKKPGRQPETKPQEEQPLPQVETPQYVPGQSVEDARQEAEAHRQQKPGDYQSQWQGKLDGILDQIQNRGPFHYDASKDPMYQLAVDQYVRLGRQAMMDSAGNASALTGGYGNSYSQTVGQQAYQGYLQALGLKLPQFHKMALDQYTAQGKDLLDRYQTLSQREKDAYGRYQKILEQYYSRQDRLDDDYRRQKDQDYHRFQDNRDFTYNQQQDALEAQRRREQAQAEQERWEAEQAYQKERDQIADQQWREQFEEDKRRYEQQWAAKHSGGGSGGSGGGYSGGGGNGDLDRYIQQHGVSESEAAARKKKAEESKHNNTRPTGPVWSPSMDTSRRPNRPVIG